MKNDELRLEEILDNDEIIQELKSNDDFQLIPFFTSRIIRQLIDYATSMPKEDDPKIGYKYPFHACEILCSGSNGLIKILNDEIDFSMNKESEKNVQDEKDLQETNNQEMKDSLETNNNEVKDLPETNNQEISNISDSNHQEVKSKENEPPQLSDNECTEFIKEQAQSQKQEQEQNQETKEIEVNTVESINNPNITETKLIEEHASLSQIEEGEIKNNDKEDEQNTKIEIPHIHILDYLFNFLKSSTDNDNYVLSGYFYKIVIHLLDINSNAILKYLYEDHPEHLDGCIKLLTKKSIGDFVYKILTFAENELQYQDKQVLFITHILNELQNSQDMEQYECTMDMLTNALSNPHFYNLLMTESSHLLELLFTILSDITHFNTFVPLCRFMIKINESILKSFPTQVTPVLHTDSSQFFNQNTNSLTNNDEVNGDFESESSLAFNIQLLFKLLKQKQFSFLSNLGDFSANGNLSATTYEQPQKCLGLKKLVQIEYIRSILDIIINTNSKNYYKEDIDLLIENLLNAKIFDILIDIFFEYQFNNLFQTFFGQIIVICVNERSPANLIEIIFDEKYLNLNSKLIEFVRDKLGFSYNSNQVINSCSFSSAVTILNNILNSTNIKLKEIISNQKDTIAFNEIVISTIMSIFNQKLLLNESLAFSGHFDSDHKEEENIKMSKYSFRETVDQYLIIYDEYKNGGDYKQLLITKILREKESIGELDDNLDFNIEMNDDNIFEKREDLDNKNNDLFDESPEIDSYESNRPFQIISDFQESDDQLPDQYPDDYFDNNFWKKTEVDEKLMASILSDLEL